MAMTEEEWQVLLAKKRYSKRKRVTGAQPFLAVLAMLTWIIALAPMVYFVVDTMAKLPGLSLSQEHPADQARLRWMNYAGSGVSIAVLALLMARQDSPRPRLNTFLNSRGERWIAWRAGWHRWVLLGSRGVGTRQGESAFSGGLKWKQ
jgi:hypothetical protein